MPNNFYVKKMFSKQTLVKIFFLLTIFLTILPKFVRADDDDDDNIVGEIIVDLFVGIALAACETSAACSSFMTIISLIFLFIGIITWCASGADCRDCSPSRKSFRRAGTTGIGYAAGRSLFRR